MTVSTSQHHAARPLAMPWERRGRPALTGAWWVRAMRLDERAARWPDAETGLAGEGGGGDPDSEAVADIRFRRWRDAFADLAPDALDRQAAEYGGTPEQLRALLAEPPERLARRLAKPDWAGDVERIARTAGTTAADPAGRSTGQARSQESHDGWRRGFARVVEPFVREALRRFDAITGGTHARAATGTSSADHAGGAGETWDAGGIRDAEDSTTPGDAEADAADPRDAEADAADPYGVADRALVRNAVRAEAARRLVRLATRVLVLELNVLRVTGRLEGDTPQDRFQCFVRHFEHPGPFAALLDEYAVLARLMAVTAEQVATVHAEFLRRLTEDRPELAGRLFAGADPGPLTRVELAKGDTHAGGRSVGVVAFASGARAVYKPRPLGMHLRFNDAVEWYNRRLPASSALRTLTVVDRGEHGWVEFVDPAPCADAAAATRYFRRQGALLALLHALGGVDFHFENLIAAGDQPVPIDLETLFCADLPRSFGSPTLDGDPATTAYRESVGRVGLLPSVVVGADGQAFDAGGMGGDKDAALPYRVADWTAAGTDTMHLQRVRPVLRDTRNRPRLDATDLDAARYAAPLLEGYREGYGAILAGRRELLSADGAVTRFGGDLTRVIARPTHEYATLLAETTHPDLLRDALDRDQVFGVLWARAADDPARARLVRHEVADLWSGDVPLFTARVGSRDVRAADGTTVPGLLPESGAARVGRTLAGMGERDLGDQRWIVSAHLATRPEGAEPAAPDPAPARPGAGAPAGPGEPDEQQEDLAGRALAAARTVADRLEASAYTDGKRLGWLGLDLWQESRWSVRPLGVDLYNGYAGIALFLAQLAHVTGEPRHAALARSALAPVVGHAREALGGGRGSRGGEPGAEAVVGAFTGLSGVAYALAWCAALLDDAPAAELVGPLLTLAAERVGPDAAHDVISGTAGCLAVAEALSAGHGPQARRVAARSAEALVAAAVTAGTAVAWPGAGRVPLLGFSHGAAGAGWALLSYAARTGDDGARAAGLGAFAYEHGAYDARSGNWPDHRKTPPGSQHTWCHGAPGVGLARAAVLRAQARTPGADAPPEHLTDLRRALDSTARFGRHRGHSLCHGALGNLELLAAAADLGEPGARRAWALEASAAVAGIERDGPVCGTPGGVVTPGLMTGLAGIGHGLLRIAAPGQVPPVLLLAPPPLV